MTKFRNTVDQIADCNCSKHRVSGFERFCEWIVPLNPESLDRCEHSDHAMDLQGRNFALLKMFAVLIEVNIFQPVGFNVPPEMQKIVRIYVTKLEMSRQMYAHDSLSEFRSLQKREDDSTCIYAT